MIAGVQPFSAEAVVDVADLLALAGVPCWVDGGWGIDVLLRRQTREHWDLDLVVDQLLLRQAVTALGESGYSHEPAVTPGLPARMVLGDEGRRQIDLHPVVLDEHGNGWQPLGDGAWAQYPQEGLGGLGEIAGRVVRCLTASLQLRHHLGYVWDDHDRQDMAHLAEKFGISLPPDEGEVLGLRGCLTALASAAVT
jgi:lincosamide nucleotidyltransferase A/C/D/E